IVGSVRCVKRQVLYRPRVESRTWLLWFGPLLVLLLGGGAVVFVVRRRSVAAPALPADEQEW
ncbi:cytochrome c-type biogenesis protein CcmH, partial [Xanthomonas hortorum pv. pelargonii]|uniref:cytochrome c-type biogenesis protein CcmH n=1 Tax=Xanthomonas hortorum TaxID=56454 RepID=UPI002042CEA5